MLLSEVGRATARKFGDYLEPTGLKTRHMIAMFALRNGHRSQQDLALALGVNATKLVTVLNDLETDGLTVRRRDPHDRRRHTVSLSELGHARLAGLDVAREKFEAAVFRDMTRPQKAMLESLLERIAANLGITRAPGSTS